MLRRNSSRKTNRRPLSRSQSTNSVVRSPIRDLESIDPAKAERDANIAAVLSYHRAQDRPNSERMTLPRDPASFYDKSSGTGSVIRNSPQRTDNALSRHGTSDIARQRSVRFAGPSALPRRNVASRANGGRDSPTKATSTIHAFGKANTRPSSTLSFHREKTNKFSLTRRYLETLQPPEECYNHQQQDAVSLSSSYKKIRKSRSMMTSSHINIEAVSTKDWAAENDMRPRSSPLPPTSNDDERLKDARPKTAALRAATSMSFLRIRRKTAASRASSNVEDSDAALRLARERFRQIQEEEAKKSQQSTLLRPKTRESQYSTTLRKSLRNSSNNSAALSSTFSTNSASVSKQHGIRTTARKVSHGLRSKLRGLFGKGKSEDSEPEYDQCVVERDSDGESCLHVDAGDTATKEEASVFQVTSHVPSLHDVPSNKKLRSRKGSVESFIDAGGEHCVSDDRSRVTSWTNSMTSQETIGEKDRQRLSIIKETAMTTENDFERNRENCEAMNKQWPQSTIRCVQPDDDEGSRYLSLSTLDLPARQDTGSEKDLCATDDSIYSFSAEDTPLPPAIGLNLLEQSPGRRSIRQPSPEISIYAPAYEHQRDTSTASSVEWKTWLSSKVSKLEGPSTPTRRKQNGAPTMGHVRELASMGSTPELSVSKDKRTPNRSPLGSIKGNAQAFPDDSSPTRLSRRVIIGYDENAAPNYEEKTADKERTPSIPRRSTLRAVPSLPSVISRGSLMETGSGREMHRMRSLNTLGRLNSTPEESIAKRRSRTRIGGWQGSPTKSSPGVSGQGRAHVARTTDSPDLLGRHR
ncbi:hypothetical protein FGSG_00193 [Fusarium graminearum PH-1]|uniref:Chromosome 1, complete genome n=1 Tax=Gibberella zeae (strain ATCC MYA-4620 / CBS 123657 / FGSC 9075 / NRRL 31084 / PH-1) TaxID=229533 RepID=I1R9P0_GIBZE|nr:hypothetical protein FGSG_00193 [Fusarium graminearum PH-1]ESU05326.1 hypothetical protein FGSG_00193 [Fusarium graminearum PH-1]CAF3555815.1 unnamed protein product [Fusarium graminearum]CEF72062.1 unnamed protein product [Fusarium graminearum]|eukprot:XP_011315811.1 hypothetical protein FGSG_00193 [Fusarium graminearum PH-1]